MTHSSETVRRFKASEALRGVLSDHALRMLDAKGATYDVGGALRSEQLRTKLLELDLPVYESILEYERVVGGICYGSNPPSGPLVAITAHSKTNPLRREHLLRYGDQLLLPVTGPRDTETWIDEQGTLYLVSPDSDFCEPCDGSFIHELEREAFGREDFGSFEHGTAASRPFGVVVYALMGEKIAQGLGVPPFPPTWDDYGKTWFLSELTIEERRIKDYRRDTTVRAKSTDDAVRAMQIIQAAEPRAVMRWFARADATPRPGEPVLQRFPCFDSAGNELATEIRVHGGPGDYRIIEHSYARKVRRLSQRGPKASESLRAFFSDHAIHVLDTLDRRRDLAFTCPPDRLRAMLTERGLPIYDKVLELEAIAGGISFNQENPWGTFASLADMERRAPLHREGLRIYQGRLLLPVHTNVDLEHWMDELGTIYTARANSDICAPAHDSFVSAFERLAFLEETLAMGRSDPRFEKPRSFAVRIFNLLVGEVLGKCLGAPQFPPASDEYGGTWFREGILIEEQRAQIPRCITEVHTESVDDAVRAMQAIIDAEPRAMLRWIGRGGVARSDEPVVLRIPYFDQDGEEDGEILVHGSPGDYRVTTHSLPRPPPGTGVS